MRHPSEGELQAHLDGELERHEAARVQEHLAGCPECRAGLSVLRGAAESFSDALLVLDSAAPEGRIPDPADFLRSGRRSRAGWGALARAAVLILAVVGTAAALVPGSPVREWLDGVFERQPAALVAPAFEEAGSTASSGPAAVLVPTAEGQVEVELTGFAPESRVLVRLSDSPSATVRVTGPASRPRFVVGPGRVEAAGEGEAEILVELPRAVSRATVSVDGRLAVLASEGRLQLGGAALDTLTEDVQFRVGR